MAPTLAVNRDLVAGSPDNAPAKGRASVYSEVQSSRINNALPLPSVLKGAFKIVEGPASSAAGNPGLMRLFIALIDLYNSRSCISLIVICISLVVIWFKYGLEELEDSLMIVYRFA